MQTSLLFCLLALPVACNSGSGGQQDSQDTDPAMDTGSAPVDSYDSVDETGEDIPLEWQAAFNEVVLAGSHNSYSKERGTILGQLTRGVRCLELDIHDNEYQDKGGYRLGHYTPGDGVAAEENGVGLKLTEWLGLVSEWSLEFPDHAPIMLVLDLKDDLTDNTGPHEGNMGALNEKLLEAFGDRLYSSREQARDGWPSAHELRGRVLVQLSGDSLSRERYLRDKGYRPAVSMNAKGQVIEVHDSGAGHLWYWTGQLQSDGRVLWKHHGKYDTGYDPAVAIDEDGWIVEVHKSESNNHLWAHAAYMRPDYTLEWGDSQRFEKSGVEPSVAFLSDSGEALERHRSSGDASQNESVRISLDRSELRLSFGDAQNTSEERFNESESVVGNDRVWVSAFSDHSTAGEDTLVYGTDSLLQGRIRFDQLAFVDHQPSNSDELRLGGARIYNVKSGAMGEVESWRKSGWMVRMWGFDRSDAQPEKTQPNCPATDEPASDWYLQYLSDVGALF